jgi:leader peptidase (prepilin peptidase) / N-methyltransferase
MISIFVTYFFLLGLIIGSFLNVVILRYNTGRGLYGRSGCMTCRRTLSWFELIPVLSWLIQRGRCRGCSTKISVQYPIVEFITGLLFAANFFYIYNSVQSVLELALIVSITTSMWMLFIVVYVYDLRHKIIPDIFSFTLFGLSILFVLVTSWGFWLSIMVNICAGLFFYFCIWLLWKISKGTWIGLGDAKLLLSIGTTLGFVYGLSALFVGFWIGALYTTYLLCTERLSKKNKHITMRTEIPLGPFLILGFVIVYFTNIDVTNLGFLLEYYAI